MLANGFKISSMEKMLKSGQILPSIIAIIKMGRKMRMTVWRLVIEEEDHTKAKASLRRDNEKVEIAKEAKEKCSWRISKNFTNSIFSYYMFADRYLRYLYNKFHSFYIYNISNI